MELAREILGVRHEWLGFVDSGLPQGDPPPPLPEGCFALVPLEDAARPLVAIVRDFRPHVLVTYDENGGYWDHVPPPAGPGWSDRWGPGTRIPAIIVSPFAKRGHVDKTPYDTTSIIKLITRRHGLEPLPGVRANVGDLAAALQ